MSNQEDKSKSWSRKKRVAVKLSVVLASVAFALLVAEVALRVVGYTYPVFYTADERLGYVLQPGAKGWYRKEGRAYIEINSDGWRDRERVKRKPPGTLRVAVLGDSYVEALQVSLEESFPSVLEEHLRRECRAISSVRKIEVLNFGVSGYGTAQELIALRERVWDYSPDVVLLAFYTANDVSDNSRALKKTDEIPYFVLRDGELAPDESFRDLPSFRLRISFLNRLGRALRDNSRVMQAIHEAHRAIKTKIAERRARHGADNDSAARPAPEAQTDAAVAAPASAELGVDNVIYREPTDEVWRDAWRVTEKLLVRMRDEAHGKGARFIVVTLSNGAQAHPDPKAREEFLRRVGGTDMFYPDRRVKSFGELEGFEVFNLAPLLQAHAEQNRVFLHGFDDDIGNGHWNAAGHKAAGEMVARKLCEVITNERP